MTSGETGQELLRSSAYTSIATVGGVGVAFLVSVVAARSLGPAGKGTLDLLMAGGVLAATVLGFAASAGITFGVASGRVTASRVPYSALLAALAVGLIATTIVLLLLGASRGVVRVAELGEALAVGTVGAATVLVGATRAALSGLQRIGAAAWIELAARACGLGALVVMATLADPITFALMLALSLAVASIGHAAVVRPAGLLRLVERREILRYALPAYVANCLQFLNYRVDLLVLGLLRGPSDVGLYALAAMIGQLLWVVPGAVAAALFPAVAAGADPVSSARRAAFASRVNVAIAAFGAVVIAVFANLLLAPVFGSAFTASLGPLLILLPGVVAFIPTTAVASYFAGVGRPAVNARVSAISFAVTLILDITLIPRYGIHGAAVASSFSYAIATAVAVGAFIRLTGLPVRELLFCGQDDLRVLTGRRVGRGRAR